MDGEISMGMRGQSRMPVCANGKCPTRTVEDACPYKRGNARAVGNADPCDAFALDMCCRRGAFHMLPKKERSGYGIRPYDIEEIYLFLRREQALAIGYETEYSAKYA